MDRAAGPLLPTLSLPRDWTPLVVWHPVIQQAWHGAEEVLWHLWCDGDTEARPWRFDAATVAWLRLPNDGPEAEDRVFGDRAPRGRWRDEHQFLKDLWATPGSRIQLRGRWDSFTTDFTILDPVLPPGQCFLFYSLFSQVWLTPVRMSDDDDRRILHDAQLREAPDAPREAKSAAPPAQQSRHKTKAEHDAADDTIVADLVRSGVVKLGPDAPSDYRQSLEHGHKLPRNDGSSLSETARQKRFVYALRRARSTLPATNL